MRRASSRTRARGAAYTELLAIMPALIVINMALLHLWNAYAAKQWSMHTSRHGAWTPAVKGCQGAQGNVQGARATAPGSDPTLNQLQGQVQEARQHAVAPSIKAPLENLAKQTNGAQAQGRSQAHQTDYAVFGSGTYGSEGTVLCNEVPRSINAADEKRAVDDAWKKYVR
ncbi:MAG: hypothetical protein KF819_39005 [Labilithrix sp.]|nr:hypothetical protein [Labilithrix sp.]